jgi:hypothetical protein
MNLRAFRSASDQRPESYKPNIPSARLGEFIGPERNWRARWGYLNLLAGATTVGAHVIRLCREFCDW